MEKYTIYKITNLVNNKIYIGASTNGADFRLKQHVFKANTGSNYPLHQAIRKFGKEAFIAEEIEMCENFEAMNLRETYWIAQLSSTDERYGYNVRCGGGIHRQDEQSKQKIGDYHRGKPAENKKPVLQYDCEGCFLQQYSSITEASEKTGISAPSIIRVLNKNASAFSKKNPYVWLYRNENEEVLIKIDPNDYYKDLTYTVVQSDAFVSARCKIIDACQGDMMGATTPIEQYDLNGVLIAKYRSLNEATKATGVSQPTIRKYINDDNYINTVPENRRKYIWKKGDPNDPKLKITHTELLKKAAEVNTIRIDQFDLKNNYIKTFDGIRKLAKELHADDRTIKKYIAQGEPFKGHLYKYKTEQSNI